jgi:mono/diheme cytochrome c family protein
MQRGFVLILALASACVGSIGDNPIEPKPLELELAEVELSLAATPGFADERGGGIFLDAQGALVRLRADGTKGRLESHPGNAREPGEILRVFPTGPFSALVSAENGLYMAESGWLIEPSFQQALSAEGVVAVAYAGDGIAWIAHEAGLFRLEGGALFELKAEGEALTGISALAVAPAPDGANAVWFAVGDTLRFAKQTARQRYEVNEGGLSRDDLKEKILALGGVSSAPGSPGQLWLITERVIMRHDRQGWVRYQAKGKPTALAAAGRFVWVCADERLYRYDVSANVWNEVRDVRAPSFLAADASGTLWLTQDDKTLQVRPFSLPRVLGLFESARVYASDLSLRAQLPADAAPEAVVFALDDGEEIEQRAEQALPGEGALPTLDFALGGFDAAGREKTFSLAGLPDGLHTLTVRARFRERETLRSLNFDLRTGGQGALSYARDVRPIFLARCAKCHEKGPGHVLTSYDDWLNDKERIVAAVLELRMPADGPLDPAQITILQRWARGGALP